MTTGKDKTKAVVSYFVCVVVGFFSEAHKARGRIGFEFFGIAAPPANSVNSLMLGGLYNPRAWEFGNSGGWPLVHGSDESLLGTLFGQFEVADQPDQGSHDAAPIRRDKLFQR